MSISFEVYEKLLNRVVTLSVELERQRSKAEYFESRFHAQNEEPVTQAADVVRLVRIMSEESLIEAIRVYRSLTGLPLKESKEAVEKVMRRAPR